MENPDTLATFGTQDTRSSQTKQKTINIELKLCKNIIMLDLDLIVHVCIQAIFSKILLKYLTLILYSCNMCITIIQFSSVLVW
jgi:hypothetical protein